MLRINRMVLALALVAVAGAAAPARAEDDVTTAATAYAAIRIVKETAGEPGTPQITLPAGYTFVSGSAYRWASRGEYYAFVQGPQSNSVQISVSWPQNPIAFVVTGETRVAFTRDPGDPGRVTFRIPVMGTSATAVRNTVEVFSFISGSTASGVYWRVEHNHPDRAAGVWTTVPWPATQSRAFLNFLVASEAILQDSGLAAEARRRGHFYALMGFETNNLTHLDNPPHWHLSYYPGIDFGAPRAHVPHLWMDAQGRVFYNGMDIQGQGRSRFYAGDPAPIHDIEGNLVVTLTIRHDGGLDIDPPAGPTYSIVAPTGDFGDSVRVLKAGQRWRQVVAEDDYVAGIMTTNVASMPPVLEPYQQTVVYTYDALTGVIRRVERTTAPS